jgi:hypothetical protein
MKRRLILTLAVSVLSGFLFAQGLQAAVPQMINYQGTLTDKSGTPVNGSYAIEFKLYDVPSGGAALWSEQWAGTSQIPVVGGTFNVMLGFLSPIPTSFFSDHPVTYLGIKVGADSEMLPRQQITSVGYAFTAGNGVPKGGIIMWSGTIDQIPASWALCDGVERTLPDGSKITPPDLTDRFVLGAGRGYAAKSTGGSSIKDLRHTHPLPAHTHSVNNVRRTAGSHEDNSGFDMGDWWGGWTSSGAPEVAVNIESSGNASQDIMPPYFALAFVMKL